MAQLPPYPLPTAHPFDPTPKAMAFILKRSAKIKYSEGGFLLPIVIITGLILGAGIIALSARNFSALIGSIRSGQGREAREAAEAGLMLIRTELNRKYPYFLTSSCTVDASTSRCIVGMPGKREDWIPASEGGTWTPITSICSTSSTRPIDMQSRLSGSLEGGRSRYQLISYRFEGDEIQGGVGTFKVKGESLVTNNNQRLLRATSVIEESIAIIPKSCGCPPFARGCPSGFAGLLGRKVDFKNNDLFGSVNANIVCLDCLPVDRDTLAQKATPDGIDLKNNGLVSGDIYGGNIPMPPPKEFPVDKSAYQRATITSTTTFAAGQSNGGACYTDNTPDKVTHCLINRINLTGNQDAKFCIFSTPGSYSNSCNNNQNITVDSQFKGGIRFYFDRTDAQAGGNIIDISGKGSIIHQAMDSLGNITPRPEQLSMFGLPSTGSSSQFSQTINYTGGSTSLATFMYFPDAKMGVNGGSSSPDLEGAFWTKEFNGSASNNVDLRVPANMGSLLWLRFGPEYTPSVREYAAVGTISWRTFQIPTK